LNVGSGFGASPFFPLVLPLNYATEPLVVALYYRRALWHNLCSGRVGGTGMGGLGAVGGSDPRRSNR
jgi:hypothetical protein